MRMKVEINESKGEAVEDWTAFRYAFEEAAAKLGLTVEQILHVKEGHL
jgi:hypothetical protein